jgi:long-subunit acyl-CoA synthetase (AMP-forming)
LEPSVTDEEEDAVEVTTAERYASGGPGGDPAHANVFAAFLATADRLGDDVAIRTEDDSVAWSWSELAEKAGRIAGGFAELGLGKGETVAMMLNNRPEFIPCDLGAVALGGVPFSIYQTSTPEQIAYVVGDAGARIAVVESAFLPQFEEARRDLPELEHLVVLDGEDGLTLSALEESDPGFDARSRAEEVGLDDLLTLIYTSGTTGPPKGVQLTHRNLMALTASVEGMIELPERGGKVISWLPAAHIAERGAHYYLPVVKGLQVTICPDPRRIVEFLPKVRPTWFFAVPRIWEKLKAGLEAQLGGLPEEQRAPVQQGLEAALRKVRLEQSGEEVPDELADAVAQAEEQMFSGLRTALGLDEAVAVNVGAAPTPLEVLEFFHAIGIRIGELWGMSETCGVATLNPPERVKLGTVGPPVPGVEVKLAEDGEVLVRGDGVMPGYRNLPEKTAEAFEDGWLLTGDIGALDEDGYLRIVDRKKELIINAAGKNMSPANIEAKLKAASPLIGQCVAIGDRRPYNVALIVLDPDYAPVWAKEHGLEGKALEELAGEGEVEAAISSAVEEANSKLARVEQIKKFEVLPEEWAPGGDELTPTMKLKRRPIAEKYEQQIEALYA